MFRLFVSFTLLIFIAIVSIGGCDGGGSGDGNGSEPTPKPTPIPTPVATPSPTPNPQACNNCPCDFFSVPMTSECWVSDSATPEFSSGFGFYVEHCVLIIPGNVIIEMDVSEDLLYPGTVNDACAITNLQSDTCNAPDFFQGPITHNQIANCRTCLEKYATELNNAGIGVSGGPPYMCFIP